MQKKTEETVIDGYDILSKYKNEYFTGWEKFYQRYYVKPWYPQRNFQHIFIAFYIIKRFMQLIVHDILHEGMEYYFLRKNGEPYMSLSIKDFHNAWDYKWKAKFRGHNYKMWIHVFPRLRQRMKGYRVYWPMIKKPRGHRDEFYKELSRLVRGGMDYEEVPQLLTNAEIKERNKKLREKLRLEKAEK